MHDLGLSPRSMARKSSAIKGFYRFLLRENHISVDPTALLERPRIGRPLPKVLSQQEIERILQQPDLTTPFGLRDRAILEILYATGIRESELIDLKLGNLNAAAEFLSVTGKGGRERIVPIGQYAIAAVNEYLKSGRNKLLKDISERTLFLNPYGKPMSRMGVWKIIRKYALMAGINRDVSPHVFRHSCATHMLEGGAGIIAVQEMLGHVDVSTTQIYTHLTGKDLKNIHRKAHPRGK
jgi:integrase/recombinase XerD